MEILYILIVPVLFGVFCLIRGRMRLGKRKAIMREPFREEWVEILKKNLPPYSHLEEGLRKRLHGYINIFLREKTFEGCGGLEITDEIRITIAAEACLLLINHPNRFYPTLKTILVYPDTYVATHDPTGSSTRLGESWQNGPVVLAWNSVKGGAVNFEDGQNVAIHEFAHQLDQEDGSGDGAPILSTKSAYSTWAKVFNKEFKRLQKRAKKHRKSVMDDYGATNPAEFFAVATETFFEKPRQMKKKHPELFKELKSYYKLNPENWVE